MPEVRVEHADDQAQVRVELLGLQRGVDVAHVVLLYQRQGARRTQPGTPEGVRVEAFGLHDGYPQAGDLRAVVAPFVPQNHDHVRVVARDQFVDEPVGQRIVTAHDKVVVRTKPAAEPRFGGHAPDRIGGWRTVPTPLIED